MKFLQIVFWEFVQNLPLVSGFVLGVWSWQRGLVAWAIAGIAVSSIFGALVIRLTESKIIDGHQEPWHIVIANVGIFVTGMLVLSVYLAIPWGDWKSDVLIGVVSGAVIGIAQELAAGKQKRMDLRHSAAFAASFPVALIGIRMLMLLNLPAVVTVLVITAIISVLIGFIDYGPTLQRRSG
jgi:hypothetical protein